MRVVDYRHLIGALVKKPQAFRHSVFRDELFPRPAFRRAWEALDAGLEPREAPAGSMSACCIWPRRTPARRRSPTISTPCWRAGEPARPRDRPRRGGAAADDRARVVDAGRPILPVYDRLLPASGDAADVRMPAA